MFDTTLLKSCGEDVVISPQVEIKRPHLVAVGDHICIDSGFYLTAGAELGDYVHIGPYVCVIGGEHGLLKMGNFTNIAAGGRVVCGSDEFRGAGFSFPGLTKYRDRLIIEPVVIGDFVGIGASVTILPGVELAEGCVVGAGAVVTRSTEPWTIYAGVPAQPVGKRPSDDMRRFARELGY